MAEIAIPLLALGGFYLISNQKKDSTIQKEGFSSGAIHVIPEKNYPTIEPISNSNIRVYGHPANTDKYYADNIAQVVSKTNPSGSVGSGSNQHMSLAGNLLNKDQFVHNNQVPYFGSHIRGATLDANIAESRLDNLQGAGSQMIKKVEQAPLFQPQKDLQHAHGAPNQTEFMMSRINPSNKMANVKPWEEEKIGPGLGMGYTTEAGPGYNAGANARDQWLPKTVNELRVDSNPIITYSLSGHEGPAQSAIMESGTVATQGKVEKHLPDTYYDVGPSRWFTTTGLEQGQTSRSIEVLQDQNRSNTTCEYFGTSKDKDASYVTSNHEQPKRPCLEPNSVTNLSAPGKYNSNEGDYGYNSYENKPNNRHTTKQSERHSGILGLMRAAIAPVLDVLRPSRKENVIGNARPNGNIGITIPDGPIYNPADRLRTTVKETTEGKLDCNHLNIEHQNNGGYFVNKQQSVDVQRDTTNHSHLGNVGPGEQSGIMSYDSNYRQRNNPNKTYINRPNQGGTQIFNQQENISIRRCEGDRNNNRMWAPNKPISAIPSQDTYGKLNVPNYSNQDMSRSDRIDSDLLTAFKNNPYTQSLNSWA